MDELNRNNVNMDLEALLPLGLIRAHIKANDIVTITDDQLSLYRESAFEAAGQFTGLWLRGKRWVTETVKTGKRMKPVIAHKLKYPPLEGRIHVFGDIIGGSRIIHVTPGACSVDIPTGNDWLKFNDCCDPCSTPDQDRIAYWTGLDCVGDFPAGIRMGMLKYIAFNVANPGDIGVTTLNSRPVADFRVISNDPVTASGALSEWHRYRRIC